MSAAGQQGMPPSIRGRRELAARAVWISGLAVGLIGLVAPRSLGEAAERMSKTRADVLLVVARGDASRLMGLLTLRDLLEAHSGHMDRAAFREPAFEIMPGTQVFRAR